MPATTVIDRLGRADRPQSGLAPPAGRNGGRALSPMPTAPGLLLLDEPATGPPGESPDAARASADRLRENGVTTAARVVSTVLTLRT